MMNVCFFPFPVPILNLSFLSFSFSVPTLVSLLAFRVEPHPRLGRRTHEANPPAGDRRGQAGVGVSPGEQPYTGQPGLHLTSMPCFYRIVPH